MDSDGCADADDTEQLLVMKRWEKKSGEIESEVAATCSRRVTMTNLFLEPPSLFFLVFFFSSLPSPSSSSSRM